VTTQNTTMQMRRATALVAATNNIILAAGEFGLETDTNKLKFGNGSTHWNDLPYIFANSVDPANVFLPNVPCDATVYVGAAVIMAPDGSAYNGLAIDVDNSNIIGFCETKVNATTCNIRCLGLTPEIFVGLDVTKEYYLSDTVPGEITIIPPTTSGHVVLKVGQPFSTKKFFVLKGTRMVRA
jgi:hypothetical protein